jgi:hypothetical protein
LIGEQGEGAGVVRWYSMLTLPVVSTSERDLQGEVYEFQ